jgi:soluble lytic murein transglycosylase-like protein
MQLSALFLAASIQYGLPPGLLDSVCWQESHYDVKAIRHNDGNGHSRDMGHTGSLQSLYRPEVSIPLAAKYLAKQVKRYGGNYAKAVTAYNQGTTYSHGGSRYFVGVMNCYLTRCYDRPL